MFDVDVHIIRFDEPDWMMERCLKSLSGQPVNIHIVQGTLEFPPFEGRKRGFALGSAPFVSYVDPDDVVFSEAYKTLLEHSDVDVVWGNEEIWHEGIIRRAINKNPHHAYIVRRGLKDFPYEKGACDLYWELHDRPEISRFHVDKVLYRWNESEGFGYNNRNWWH